MYLLEKRNENNRISILGNSGAGKSTLAKKIGEKLEIEVLTIDKIYWRSGWRLRDQSSYKKFHGEWVSRYSWIIDGVGYWEELESRIKYSDLVIYFDVPVSICKKRAQSRINDEKHAPNPYIVEGCRYENVRELQMTTIENFEVETKPKIIQLINRLDSNKVQVIQAEKDLKL